MIEFQDINGNLKLKIFNFVKNFDEVVRIVYFKVAIEEETIEQSGEIFDAEETDFLDLKEKLSMLTETSKEIYPLVFDPLINARFKLFIERLNRNYKLDARFYHTNYKDYDVLTWKMNKNGLRNVMGQINEIFP